MTVSSRCSRSGLVCPISRRVRSGKGARHRLCCSRPRRRADEGRVRKLTLFASGDVASRAEVFLQAWADLLSALVGEERSPTDRQQGMKEGDRTASAGTRGAVDSNAGLPTTAPVTPSAAGIEAEADPLADEAWPPENVEQVASHFEQAHAQADEGLTLLRHELVAALRRDLAVDELPLSRKVFAWIERRRRGNGASESELAESGTVAEREFSNESSPSRSPAQQD
jgi:hypothetical protein